MNASKAAARAIHDVMAERNRQDEKWGGPEHDDGHTFRDYVRWIKNYAGWSDQMADGLSWEKARRRMVQVAALAIAAIEWVDRNHDER